MSEIFHSMRALVAASAENILAIDWSQYGTNLHPYKDGLPKFTGMLLHVVGDWPLVGAHTCAFGFLPTPEKSAATVVNKVQLVREKWPASTSLKIRNPEANLWGGAVRCNHDHSVVCAVTGLPEIGDHLLVAQVMRACDLIWEDVWEEVTSASATGMPAAMELAGMSPDQLKSLKHLIFDIVQDGIEATRI